MTREEREIIEAIKSMGYDRTAYPREKVSAVISMAIEALKEQEISNELQEYAYECGYEHFFHECQNCEHRRIGNKAQDWIPCSKELPKTMGEYFVTVLSNPSKNLITSAAFYSTVRKEFGTFRHLGEWEKWDVVAWMPRLKPYREDEEV